MLFRSNGHELCTPVAEVFLFQYTPLVPCDADSGRQWLPQGRHEPVKLPGGHQAKLLVVLLKQLVLFDDVGIARAPALGCMDMASM